MSKYEHNKNFLEKSLLNSNFMRKTRKSNGSIVIKDEEINEGKNRSRFYKTLRQSRGSIMSILPKVYSEPSRTSKMKLFMKIF